MRANTYMMISKFYSSVLLWTPEVKVYLFKLGFILKITVDFRLCSLTLLGSLEIGIFFS